MFAHDHLRASRGPAAYRRQDHPACCYGTPLHRIRTQGKHGSGRIYSARIAKSTLCAGNRPSADWSRRHAIWHNGPIADRPPGWRWQHGCLKQRYDGVLFRTGIVLESAQYLHRNADIPQRKHILEDRHLVRASMHRRVMPIPAQIDRRHGVAERARYSAARGDRLESRWHPGRDRPPVERSGVI